MFRIHRSFARRTARDLEQTLRVLGVALLCATLWWAHGAGAQPVPAIATPPQRADVALRGQGLATVQSASASACLAECRRLGASCTGFNFATGSARLPLPVPGTGRPAPQPSNCTLLSGSLADAPVAGVISCRMPCDASQTQRQAGSLQPVKPLPGGVVRPLPGSLIPPAAPPVAGTVAPVRPPLVAGGTALVPAAGRLG